MAEQDSTISILTTLTEEPSEIHTMFPSPTKLIGKASQITVQSLAENLSDFVRTLGRVVEELPESVGQYDVDSLTFSMSVDGEGKISLVGELSAGFTSGIIITLKKRTRRS